MRQAGPAAQILHHKFQCIHKGILVRQAYTEPGVTDRYNDSVSVAIEEEKTTDEKLTKLAENMVNVQAAMQDADD